MAWLRRGRSAHATRPSTAGSHSAMVNDGERKLERAPLMRSDLVEVCKSVLRVSDVPEALVEVVFRHGEGNPFFSEELLQSVLDEGIISTHSGRPDRAVETRVCSGTARAESQARRTDHEKGHLAFFARLRPPASLLSPPARSKSTGAMEPVQSTGSSAGASSMRSKTSKPEPISAWASTSDRGSGTVLPAKETTRRRMLTPAAEF